MTVHPYFDTWCDLSSSEGCHEWCEGGTGDTIREARKNSRARGWVEVRRDARRYDCCPACWEAVQQEAERAE